MLHEDAQALATLVNLHWAHGGWRRATEPFDASPVEIARATAAGYLFPRREVEHDPFVEEITLLAAALSLDDASRSFLASLSTHRLFLRPFLPSLLVARGLPAHEYMPGRFRGLCAVCGLREQATIDCDELNFERHKWGGVRHLDLRFIWFSLDRLAVEGGAEPADADYALLDAVLQGLRELPPCTSAPKAGVALKALKSNAAERRVLIKSLAVVGILQDPEHPGFLDGYVANDDRDLAPRRYDSGYPAGWWTSDCGVNEQAVRALFPHVAP